MIHSRFALSLIGLLLLQTVFAQEFVFVSDRVYQSPLKSSDGLFYVQEDLFLYRDGSELRLTKTPHRGEYDPTPSPDGKRIAYLWREVSAPRPEAATWEWHLAVMDPLRAGVDAQWTLPGSRDMTRPAGGFRIAWFSDGSSLLAQVPDEESGWAVWRFELGAKEGVKVASGYGPYLSPDERRLATLLNGKVHIWDLAARTDRSLFPGEILGWFDDATLLVQSDGGLGAVTVEDGDWQWAAHFEGYYDSFTMSPDGRRYAFLLQQEENWFVVFQDRDHTHLADFHLLGVLYSVDWLDDDRVVVNIQTEDGDYAIAALDVDGNDPILVRSHGHDFGAVSLGVSSR